MSHPYHLTDAAGLFTPALVFYPDVIRRNIARVVELAGGPARLRPHVKTHKTAEIVGLQLAAGVTKHKCATIAEAEVLAAAGVPDVLVAYPLVGPNPARLAALARLHPATHFAALVDCRPTAEALSAAAAAGGVTLGFYVDIDAGMGRTGLPAGDAAADLYEYAANLPHLSADGLHAYDGHNTQPDAADRAAGVAGALGPVLALRGELQRRGHAVLRLVAGGTPAFPVYAGRRDIPGLECSPGTHVLWDHRYGSRFPDHTGLTPAAVLLTRVVSRPRPDRVTFDLGSKAVAADPPLAERVHLLDAPPHEVALHSEEHLVIETPDAAHYTVGDLAYALPGHVCPSVALHEFALVAEGGRIVDKWLVAARRRALTV